MKTDDARMLVIGAGVNGSICAVGLHRAGFNVTLLARGKRLDEIRAGGVVIENPLKRTRSVTPVAVIDHLDPDDVYDYVLVVVRKNQVGALLPVLAANRSPNVVFMVNNPTGPDEWTAALGRERVLLGFVFGAGKREGSLIRAFSSLEGWGGSTPFGEIDGTLTPRLERLVSILCTARLNSNASTDICDYLALHACTVAPLGHMLLHYGCDNRALARAPRDLGLLVDAMREVLDVMQALGHKIVPPRLRVLRFVPRFVLVGAIRLGLATHTAEVGAAWHCQQAPDEIRQLGVELMALVEKSRLPAPALHKLFALEVP